MNNFLTSLLLLLLSGAIALGQVTAPEIFLKGIPRGFETVDVQHDDDGNTYVLGTQGTTGVIVRYDSTGETRTSQNIIMANFSPVAFDVVSNADGVFFYVASTNNIRKYTLNQTGFISSGIYYAYTVTDIVFAKATGKLHIGIQAPGLPPVVQVQNSSLSFERWMVFGDMGWDRATLRSMAVDDEGALYLVGDTGYNAGTGNPWVPYGPTYTAGTFIAGLPYLIKVNPGLTSYKPHPATAYHSLFDVHFNNGWVYLTGQLGAFAPTGFVHMERRDIGLGATSKSTLIYNPDYVGLSRNTPAKMKKFSLTADALDNVYITGYLGAGSSTNFNSHQATDVYRSVASTSESAFVAKLDSDFKYQWVKAPIKSPPPELGRSLALSWDAKNSRLWWSGSFKGAGGLTMQEGADASTALTLPIELGNWQGFTAAIEPNGKFTEVVEFLIDSEYAENRIRLNDELLEYPGTVQKLIRNSNLTIQSPRILYQWSGAPGGAAGVDFETDDIDNKAITTENADSRFSFINFSVNSVVQDSNATVYTFSLKEKTTIKLEWLAEFALQVDSIIDKTDSKLTLPPDNTPYVNALTSKASGNPVPAVGKHWIEKDDPVVLEINGAVEDLGAQPGLAVRYVPWRYRLTGAATAIGSNAGIFSKVEPRQQLKEFNMTGPATVTYDWKLQFGVDMRATNLAADPDLLVQFRSAPATITTPQTDREGGGVAWYDDGTTVFIAAPRNLDLPTGLLDIKGWLNGDGHIFSPAEGSFDARSADPFSAAQKDAKFNTLIRNGIEYIGREVILNRPGRVVWNYGAKGIIKTIIIGNSLAFSESEIAAFGLIPGEEPTISSDTTSQATASDYIWDGTARKFFPVRPVRMNLLWKSTTGTPVAVEVNAVWGAENYRHIANSPGVSLIPQPPAGQPRDLVFKRVAYTTANAQADDQQRFSATQAGRTVLEFNRITPAGRGGTAQSVVEIKVVLTNLWNTVIGAPINTPIGQKITSTKDRAGLGTGYVFFDRARYNPFIYDREKFTGLALWDRQDPPGPVIPVNQNPTASAATNDEFVVVWYADPTINDHILWPYAADRYNPTWPSSPSRILMSSGFGSESVNASGNNQNVIDPIVVNGTTVPASTTFDPARFEQVQIYSQGDRAAAGYNPNEEHALMAPSLRFASVAPRPLAAYALRENDLNITARNAAYTSDPYVLVQFLDKADNEFKMKVYRVQREDRIHYPNGFSSVMVAGEPVIPFYPIGVVSGATLCPSTYAREGDAKRLTFWKDHKSTAWAVSGDGRFDSFFYYPLSPDFWWPAGAKQVGDCVAWLPNHPSERDLPAFDIDYTLPTETPNAQGVKYTTTWPLTVPTLKVGETLTFSGGEYAQDNPGNPGLPGVLAWAAGEVIFDSLNPDMREGALDQDGKSFDSYTARMVSALEERTVSLPVAQFPTALLPAGGRTNVKGTIYQFDELSASLKKRVFYNPLNGKLGIKGILNDKDIGNSTLTAAPPAVYALEPNILTQAEYEELLGTSDDSPFADLSSNTSWRTAVDALFKLTKNPNGLTAGRITAGGGYTAGLEVQTTTDPATDVVTATPGAAQAYKAKGPGLALFTNPGFLDPNDDSLPDVSFVTLAENNDPALGGSPVILHIIKIDRRERYRGAVKVVLSDNVFDENIILRHTGDFGAKPDDLVFDWWYRVEDGTEAGPPDEIPAGQTNPWKFFPDPSGNGGQGFSQLKLKGNPQAPELLLADSLWFVRYRHKDEEPSNPITWQRNPAIPYQWAGAGNSRPGDYRAQLAQGWVKRVLDAVNPYEARIRDFTGDGPATYASMIRQFGQRYEGPVALNPDKNVIENVGLIELYATILNRARNLSIDLSTPVSTPGITGALLLASTRLADFYMLLGNEAYTDAKDSTIGFTTEDPSYGALAPTIFTFQNQLDTQLAEELALLRGVDDFKARPVYNRLFWNFTKGEGEAAYAKAYNVSDVNQDGFIDENDAIILFPQGHGDAWGHYLTAIGGQYGLLTNPFFNWVSRSELYSLQNIVFEVDFLDERKFAQVAAAKAKTGAEIVDLTYREQYVADPGSQWQGYLDTNPQRSWGVEGWARRAGQGAYFDWVTANALLPSEHPNSSYTGIRKVDRTTVKDIAVVSANLNAVQQTFDDANNGFNPLGIAGNTVPFDIDPVQIADGYSHFEQIYDRAVIALDNANFVFNNANLIQNMLRQNEVDEIDFRREVFEQDMAYRNELIEIFGSPYDGTIGSGAAYPPGYRGPDTSLYMYVDQQVHEITASTVPGMASGFVDDINAFATNTWSFTDADYRVDFSSSFKDDSPSNWFGNFSDVAYITTTEDGITFNTETSRVKLTNMNLPIKASGYTFVADESWGQRSSPGQLQLHIAAMIQQEAELAQAIAAWDGFQGGVVRQLRLISAQLDADSEIRALLAGKIANNTILGAINVALSTAASALDAVGESIPAGLKAVGEFVPGNLPTAGLSFSPGDALSALRGATYTGAEALKITLKVISVAAQGVADFSELTKDLIDMGLDFAIDAQERNLALKEALVELENMVGDEGILRVEIFRQQEALRALSEEYRAMLQKGARLLDEREAYNKRVAELVQRSRYSDMSFRVSRNAALQRYQEAFDLAARYAYLAAKAYDYETNLNANDAGSAQAILTDIVRERNIGYLFYGVPQQGWGGLAEQLARMKANFDVLKGQLGINNPQTETGRFSLRKELFRIAPDENSDADWQDQLAAKKVDNLWDMPEFRRYCRPFAAYDPATPEPGLVIEFSSEVVSGKNFFGKALAGGDNAYDPTNYSTKVSSVGAWFEGYLSEGFDTGLSETPRIYLVPVGSDVMMYPSDNNLSVRLWNVLDQKIPVPFPVLGSNLDNKAWRPLDTLGGTQGEIRRFSSFRAYPDSGYFDEYEMTYDTRLVGRSVWNTRWLLIIPGRTLRADADVALDTFIENVTDIKLFFQTYGHSGN